MMYVSEYVLYFEFRVQVQTPDPETNVVSYPVLLRDE